MQLPYLFEPLNLFLCQGVLFTDDFIPLSIISKEPTEGYVSLGSVSKNKLDLINSNFLNSVINEITMSSYCVSKRFEELLIVR